MCQQNLELLNANEDSDVWKAYVDYVDEIVVDGFFNTIMCSLKFMLENTDAKTTTEPLYEAVLELQVCVSVLCTDNRDDISANCNMQKRCGET